MRRHGPLFYNVVLGSCVQKCAAWQSWCDSGWQHDHADLWNLLAAELRSRVTNVHVSWVKGHAKSIDIDRGRTTVEDKRGNDGADSLAVFGARLHHVPAEVVEVAQARKKHARSVHQMMVSILQCRLQRQQDVSEKMSDSTSSTSSSQSAASCHVRVAGRYLQSQSSCSDGSCPLYRWAAHLLLFLGTHLLL